MSAKPLYARRREIFMERMQQFLPGIPTVAILHSNPVMPKTADMDHEYRQHSDFYYLTGFNEPEAVAILAPGQPVPYTLFVRPRKQEEEVWTGRRAGLEGAKECYDADEAHDIEEVGERLPELLQHAQGVFFGHGHDEAFNRLVLDTVESLKSKPRSGICGPDIMIDPASLLHEMRLRKQPDEIELMRVAADIACEAHLRAMESCHPGMHEYELEAEIEYVFRKRGATGPSYETIVGSGDNATILHYNTNTEQMRDGQLVLIDAGAEYQMYASDVTRTFPVNGRFSPAQKEVYELVLAAQQEGIALTRPGQGCRDAHFRAVEVLTEGMVKLGWLSGNVDELIAQEAYKRFYMHGTGHWLGMDVHDVGRYKLGEEWRKLEPGMVVTVEPGLYVAPDSEGVDPRYWGIGVRIEDDVLVTESGNEVLTRKAPKEISEIEALMASRRELTAR